MKAKEKYCAVYAGKTILATVIEDNELDAYKALRIKRNVPHNKHIVNWEVEKLKDYNKRNLKIKII